MASEITVGDAVKLTIEIVTLVRTGEPPSKVYEILDSVRGDDLRGLAMHACLALASAVESSCELIGIDPDGTMQEFGLVAENNYVKDELAYPVLGQHPASYDGTEGDR